MTEEKPERVWRPLSKEEILLRITTLHEQTLRSHYLDGEVTIRELTALERMAIREGAETEAPIDGAPPSVDSEIISAMELQLMLVQPGTGEPYADGRRHPLTNELLIDPRTREPIFTFDEARAAINGREGAVNELLGSGRRLSLLRPLDFRSRGHATDSSERDEGSGVQAVEGDASDNVDVESESPDERETYDDGDGSGEGDRPR